MKNNPFIHVYFWIFMVLFIFDYHWYENSLISALVYSIAEVSTYMGLFYLTTFCYKKLNHNSFFLIVALITLIIVYTGLLRISGLEEYLYEGEEMRNIFSIVLNALLFSGLAILFANSIERNQLIQRNILLQAKNKELQIRSIQSRLNPHFIFNTLNNLSALILKGDKNLSEFLNYFSTLLRYSIEDLKNIEIPLSKEINCIESYFRLIEMQSPSATDLDLYVEGDFVNHTIMPFILTSFVENAIKHGDLQTNDNGHLLCQISCNNGSLDFELSNTMSNNTQIESGHGLKLIKEQLNNAYGTDFTLDQEIEENIYKTKLRIFSLKTIQL